VCQEGVYDKAVAAIKLARSKGFRVTINCTLFNGEDPDGVADFFDTAMKLGIEGITVSPGLQLSPRAPAGRVPRTQCEQAAVSRDLQTPPPRPAEQIAGPSITPACSWTSSRATRSYQCTPWSNPTYNVFGWQRPCYLLSDEGYASTYKSLISRIRSGSSTVSASNPRCDNCMAHCGFEGTAVNDAFSHPLKAMKASLFGPKLHRSDGARVADRLQRRGEVPAIRRRIPITEIKRAEPRV
jgi:hypothetical protein